MRHPSPAVNAPLPAMQAGAPPLPVARPRTTRAWPALAALVAGCLDAAPAVADVRPLSADRPDRTESPYTVPPGHLQLESDLVSRAGFGDRAATDAGTVNLKAGLHRALDLQLVTVVHATQWAPPVGGPPVREATWLPSLGLRLKWNLAGNDSGPSAVGMLSYVEFPFLEDDVPTTTGVLFPFAAALPAAFGFGAMAGIERSEGEGSSLVASATIGRPIAPRLGAFVEGFATWAWDGGPAEVNESTFDWGLTFDANESLRFDLGAYHGLSRGTEDTRWFAGLTWRTRP